MADPSLTAEPAVSILCNGQTRLVAPATSVADLLAELGWAGRPVAVEVNLELVPRAEHARRTLVTGDRVEIVTLVGGG